MRQLILIAIISVALNSCKDSDDSKQKAHLAIAEKYMEAVETGNTNTMDSLLADNYMGYGPSVGDSINKADAIKSFRYNADSLYESLKYTRHKELAVTVKEGNAQGDWVLNWALLTIKYKDGRGPVDVYVNAVYRVEDGKIVHSITFYNEADVLRQLGYTMTSQAE
jgi:hypothetical protein